MCLPHKLECNNLAVVRTAKYGEARWEESGKSPSKISITYIGKSIQSLYSVLTNVWGHENVEVATGRSCHPYMRDVVP